MLNYAELCAGYKINSIIHMKTFFSVLTVRNKEIVNRLFSNEIIHFGALGIKKSEQSPIS